MMQGSALPVAFLVAGTLVLAPAAEPVAAENHAPAGQATTAVVVPGPTDTASGARHALQTWQLGGIGGNWLAVGQPNTLNRDDRAVFRFDITSYLTPGRIAKARLRLQANPQTRGETFRLEIEP